ncbi:MAG: 50S ribosomal protein L6 [Parcubacteria group bacterium]|nr:50S ribosomal protein L6 [Parcubacteria group bacterium]
MSKIGKQPIKIPEGVEVAIRDGNLEFKHKNNAAVLKILEHVTASVNDATLSFGVDKDVKQARANWGTTRALSQNIIAGFLNEFSKSLEINGVGFKVAVEGDHLMLNVGFSHPVKFSIPKGVKVSVEKNVIKISGVDKQLVGETAAKIRAIKKPEPYKGKGIKYVGEAIRRKVGKKVA